MILEKIVPVGLRFFSVYVIAIFQKYFVNTFGQKHIDNQRHFSEQKPLSIYLNTVTK